MQIAELNDTSVITYGHWCGSLMHLLWCHELSVDLTQSLRPSTVLKGPI